MKLCAIPFLGGYFNTVRVTGDKPGVESDLFYLDLVDLVHNNGNKLVCDRRLSGGDKIKYSVPGSITKALVVILQ